MANLDVTHSMNIFTVDADDDSLLNLEKVLQDCNHKVTKCKEAEQCLTMLGGDRKTKFDLVMIDVDLPKIDGYQLCTLIRKENDIPIILMSSTYTNLGTVQKALSHGACDFLLKPIRVESLRKIDLCTLQNRALEKEKEKDEQEGLSVSKEEEKRKGDSITGLDPRSGKKPRVIWTSELHQKFIEAVDLSGIDKAVPKKILETMNIPGLTRENVASHLQKFRQSHKRMQGDSQPKVSKQRRRQQQKQKLHEQVNDLKIESQVVEDSSIQPGNLRQTSSWCHHPQQIIHDTTYETTTLMMDPAYETTTLIDPSGYVNASNELCLLQSYEASDMGQCPTNLGSNPWIEPSYAFGDHRIHSANMDPSCIQFGYDLVHQGGSIASQKNQEFHVKDYHWKDFNI